MPGRYDVNQLLADARSRIVRLSPLDLQNAMASGTLVLDTRSGGDRIREGTIAGSFHVPLAVLLWRVDPEADCSDPQINDLDAPLVVVCNDGYSSSWAAATLVDLGFSNAMDLAGGFRAWSAAGLPVVRIA